MEKFNHLKLENNWEPVKQVWCPCQSHCYEEKVSNIIKAKSQSKYQWDQTESYCTNNPAWYNRQMISDQVEPSKYRFRIEVDEIGIIYSNEFIITKEDIDQRKVYKNKEYGFELKYPEDWCQRDNYQGTDIMLLNTDKEIIRGGLRPDDYWLSPYNKRNPKYTDNWVGIGINAYQKPVDFNWDSWMKDNFSAIEKYENLDYSNLNSDLKGIKVVKSIGGISNIFLEGENKIFNIRFFSAFPYDVDDDGLNYFEQVISTFKFIETDISNWQTYRNEEFGFEVKYPSILIGKDFYRAGIYNEAWILVESYDENIIFGTQSSRAGGGIWGIFIKNDMKSCGGRGIQFADRKENIKEIKIGELSAKFITVTTNSHPNWISEVICIERDDKVFEIGNGAVKIPEFKSFYNSFKFID